MHVPLVVIPTGGQALRFGDIEGPKCLQKVKGVSIISRIVRFWMPRSMQIQIQARVGHRRILRKELIESEGLLPAITEQTTSSVNQGILAALRQAHCPEVFVVHLGDCLIGEDFDISCMLGHRDHVVFTRQGDPDFAGSFAVQSVAQEVKGVIEKPRCGLGVYFFRWTAIKALEETDGITDALQWLVDHGESISQEPFEGDYLNVNRPDDLERWPGK